MIAVVAAARAKLMGSPLAYRFIVGAGWSVFGSVLSSSLTLITLMVLARVLGKDVYGQFAVIQGTLSMVGIFAGFGIGAAATRYAAELKTRDTVRLGHILTLGERATMAFGLVASAGLSSAARWMATNILNAPHLSLPLAISACGVSFMALDSYQKSVLVGFESMRALAIGTVVGASAGLPIMLFTATRFGLEGAAVAMVVTAVVQAIISRYQVERELRKFRVQRGAEGCLSERSVLWRFALPALLSGALVGPAHWVAQAMLANTTNGYAELAVLSIAMQWFNVIMFVPGAAGRIVLPILTDHFAIKDRLGSRRILMYAMGANALVAVPMAVIVGVFAQNIMSLYGSNFEKDYVPLALAGITGALLAIQAPVGNLLAASSRMWLGALMNGGWASAFVIISFLLVDRGAAGIVLALCISYVFHAVWTFWYARHISSHWAPNI